MGAVSLSTQPFLPCLLVDARESVDVDPTLGVFVEKRILRPVRKKLVPAVQIRSYCKNQLPNELKGNSISLNQDKLRTFRALVTRKDAQAQSGSPAGVLRLHVIRGINWSPVTNIGRVGVVFRLWLLHLSHTIVTVVVLYTHFATLIGRAFPFFFPIPACSRRPRNGPCASRLCIIPPQLWY